jgi:hypothetical protein
VIDPPFAAAMFLLSEALRSNAVAGADGSARWRLRKPHPCERSLRRALSNYVDHFHAERNHQGKGNVLLSPWATDRQREGPVRCRARLGGLLHYYHREAA